MKHINQFITEYIIKKKLDTPINSENPIDSENQHKYFPKTKDELIKVIRILLDKGETDLNCIDTSNITDMSELFYNKNLKNVDISNWDVSNVTNMKRMFYASDNFNDNLSNWNVSNVTNMERMFEGCNKFEGKGLENWDVSNVKDMSSIFAYSPLQNNPPSWYKQ